MLNKLRNAYRKYRKEQRIERSNQFHLVEKNLEDLPELTPEQKQQILDFWGRYPFKIEYKYWQYYTKMIGKFDYRYVPDNVWYDYICPYYNNAAFAGQVDDKSMYDYLFDNLRFPKTVLRVINGMVLDEHFNHVQSGDILQALNGHESLLVKPSILTYGGAGIKFYTKDHFDHLIADLPAYKDAVIQEVLTQSACLNRINPSCINTIRISSIMYKDGTAEIPAAMLRMGVNGSAVDNASAGGIFAGINLQDGTIKRFAEAHRGVMSRVKYYEHPNTKIKFDGYQIEGFEKIKQVIYENAKYFPRTRLIGWDFCLDQDNTPILVEINLANHGIEGLQMANGAYFGDHIEQVLEEIEWDKLV